MPLTRHGRKRSLAGLIAAMILVMDRFGSDRMALIILLIFAACLPLPLVGWHRGR